jgi:hypothetical protein
MDAAAELSAAGMQQGAGEEAPDSRVHWIYSRRKHTRKEVAREEAMNGDAPTDAGKQQIRGKQMRLLLSSSPSLPSGGR